MCVHCTVHNIAQNRPDNFPSYPPDNRHCSDDVYLREGGLSNTEINDITKLEQIHKIMQIITKTTKKT